MIFSEKPKGIKFMIFINLKDATEWSDFYNFFDINKICDKCKSEMRIEYDETYVNFHQLRCIICNCRKPDLLLKGTKISSPKISFMNICLLSILGSKKNMNTAWPKTLMYL